MARFMVQITKTVPFQGRDDQFSNVYAYETGIVNPDFDALLEAVMQQERNVFANAVSFVKGSVWDVGTPPNRMRHTKTWTATTGVRSTSGSFYRECAYLIKWPLPPSVGVLRTRQRSLKKWIHSCATMDGIPSDGASPAPGAIQSGVLKDYAVAVTSLLNGGATLVSPSGAVPSGPPVIHPYLEHRQFPRGRKESA